MKHLSTSGLLILLGFIGGSIFVGSWLHGQPRPEAAPRELTSYREVVKRVLPAVVSIDTRAKPKPGFNPPPLDDPRTPEEFRKPPNDPNKLGFGSGFIVDPAGVVVTNYHVVEGAETAIVTLNDGRKFTSKDIRSDRRTDVAVILLDAKDVRFPVLEFGDSDTMEIGDRVLAVGAPFGLAGSVTAGIISAKGRGLNMNMYEDYLQTDAAINPGNSGGPLVNLEGKVIGVCAAIKSKSGGFQGVGLAVAANLAKHVVPSLKTTGTVQRGYLGAHIRDVDPNVAASLGVKDGGVVLAEIYDKTPAAKAGMKAGDIVIGVAGKTVKDGAVLQRLIAIMPIDRAVDIDLLRDGKMMRVTVVIEAQPADYGVNPSVPAPRPARPIGNTLSIDALGAEVAEMTDELAEDFGYRKGTTGVLITRVQDGGVAALSNLRPGAVISKIDQTPVSTPAAARQAMQAGDLSRGIILQVATPQGGVNYVLVKNLR